MAHPTQLFFLEDPMTHPTSMTVQDLAAWRDSGEAHLLLDVREDHELEQSAIAGATHIPMQQIPARIAELPADTPVVVMCHHGGRSQAVVNYLRQAGRSNAINLSGGIDAWARHIDGSVGRY
jgi:rhodanese-related sulfurtransferase